MNLAQAKAAGLARPTRKRVGRGVGSGLGKTSGRGHKGAASRSGWSSKLGWEGGQMPLFRRLPKVGFNNKNFARVFTVINVGSLASFADGATVDLAAVLQQGLVSQEKGSELFKVLGNGDLNRRLVVRADAVSASARQKIEQAGGSVELIPRLQHRPKFVRKDGSKHPKAVAAEARKSAPAGKPAKPKSEQPGT
jgi:large subunit ribosomal protein L15